MRGEHIALRAHKKARLNSQAEYQSLTRKIDRMGEYSLILSLNAMAICYAAQLSIKPSESSIS
jgi:proline dehydrogenase